LEQDKCPICGILKYAKNKQKTLIWENSTIFSYATKNKPEKKFLEWDFKTCQNRQKITNLEITPLFPCNNSFTKISTKDTEKRD
jgi:hypothetical protein